MNNSKSMKYLGTGNERKNLRASQLLLHDAEELNLKNKYNVFRLSKGKPDVRFGQKNSRAVFSWTASAEFHLFDTSEVL